MGPTHAAKFKSEGSFTNLKASAVKTSLLLNAALTTPPLVFRYREVVQIDSLELLQ